MWGEGSSTTSSGTTNGHARVEKEDFTDMLPVGTHASVLSDLAASVPNLAEPKQPEPNQSEPKQSQPNKNSDELIQLLHEAKKELAPFIRNFFEIAEEACKQIVLPTALSEVVHVNQQIQDDNSWQFPIISCYSLLVMVNFSFTELLEGRCEEPNATRIILSNLAKLKNDGQFRGDASYAGKMCELFNKIEALIKPRLIPAHLLLPVPVEGSDGGGNLDELFSHLGLYDPRKKVRPATATDATGPNLASSHQHDSSSDAEWPTLLGEALQALASLIRKISGKDEQAVNKIMFPQQLKKIAPLPNGIRPSSEVMNHLYELLMMVSFCLFQLIDNQCKDVSSIKIIIFNIEQLLINPIIKTDSHDLGSYLEKILEQLKIKVLVRQATAIRPQQKSLTIIPESNAGRPEFSTPAHTIEEEEIPPENWKRIIAPPALVSLLWSKPTSDSGLSGNQEKNITIKHVSEIFAPEKDEGRGNHKSKDESMLRIRIHQINQTFEIVVAPAGDQPNPTKDDMRKVLTLPEIREVYRCFASLHLKKSFEDQSLLKTLACLKKLLSAEDVPALNVTKRVVTDLLGYLKDLMSKLEFDEGVKIISEMIKKDEAPTPQYERRVIPGLDITYSEGARCLKMFHDFMRRIEFDDANSEPRHLPGIKGK